MSFNLLGGQLHIQVEKQFNLGIWLFFLVNFFFQALAEEMIYRGFVMNKLRTKLDLLPAVRWILRYIINLPSLLIIF